MNNDPMSGMGSADAVTRLPGNGRLQLRDKNFPMLGSEMLREIAGNERSAEVIPAKGDGEVTI